MRHVLVVILALGAACWLLTHINTQPLAISVSVPPPATPTAPAPARTPLKRLDGAKPETHYLALGMPGLNTGWDAPALTQTVKVLEAIRISSPQDLPGAHSTYGKGFFAKLRYTIQRFHFQTSTNKIASYNAFNGLLPIYGKAFDAGFECDMEIALLIGLSFEVLAGCSEDQNFVRDLSEHRARLSRDLEGNLWEVWGPAIYLDAGGKDPERDVQTLLHLIAYPRTLRPEARVLALSHASLHLPTYARRMRFTGIERTLNKHRKTEQHAEARALYDVLIARVN